jgi:hypothetical protein
MLPWFMTKTPVVTKKKRGPAPTGQGLQIGERWHPPEIGAIDAWIKSQGGNLTRGHAIRRLVALGLKVTKPVKATRSTSNKVRAAELAAKAIEKIIDPAAPPKERAQRRRRLTKGPTEFREDRVDLPKRKK